jgi:hypothetical protein
VDDSGNKKERIFLATLRLISENGFHGMPVLLIAQAAGAVILAVYALRLLRNPGKPAIELAPSAAE